MEENCVGAVEIEEETFEFHPCLQNQSTACPAFVPMFPHKYFTLGYYYGLYNSIIMSSVQNTWLMVFTVNERFKL